jgi:hypothetical protein
MYMAAHHATVIADQCENYDSRWEREELRITDTMPRDAETNGKIEMTSTKIKARRSQKPHLTVDHHTR